MGSKCSSAKCTPTTIEYIRNKNVKKLTRHLSKRRLSLRPKKHQDNAQQLKLDLKQDEQQRSALHFAAIEGDATIIVALFEYMHTVDVTDQLGRTPLHYAAIVGNDEALTTLLLCNPDVNRLSQDGTTPLHESIIHNHPRILTLLVQHNADLHLFYEDFLPPLILAVYLQHKNIVELLIRIGIDPNLVDSRSGRSALHYAAYFHETAEIFHLLLSSTVHHIIDINAQDSAGFSVLDYARANVHQSVEIVNLLFQLNVYDPNRGELSLDHLQIEPLKIKIFQSNDELSTLKKKSTRKSKAQ